MANTAEPDELRVVPDLGDELLYALDQHAQANRVSDVELAGWLSRAVSVLSLTWDDDVRSLWQTVTVHPSTGDIVLDDREETAYKRVVGRITPCGPTDLRSIGSASDVSAGHIPLSSLRAQRPA